MSAARSPRAGFTIVEIILVLVLLAVVAGIGLVDLMGLRSSQDLDEVAMQIEGMVRMAKADAANQGKRIRITTDPSDGSLHVLWEPDPLTAPGTWVPYTSASWADQLDLASTSIVRCEMGDPNAPAPSPDASGATSQPTDGSGSAAGASGGAGGGPDVSTFPPGITFAPDGTCDSATIELASTSDSDQRHALVEVDGLSGTVDTRILYPSDMGTDPSTQPGGNGG